MIKMYVKKVGFLFFSLLISCHSIAQDEIPKYFVKQLSEKINHIDEYSRKGASFVFITDTHVSSNQMKSPQLVRYVIDNSKIRNVIWGGDAIHYLKDDIEKQWKRQLAFDSVLNNACDYYKVRGNHDFTFFKSEKHFKGLSLSNEETADLLLKNCPAKLHRNANEKGACYYYFDDNENKLRFIVLDTTDSVPNIATSDGNILGVHETQLRWLADSAISTTPKRFSLVIVSHVPIADKRIWFYPIYQNVRQLLDGVATRSSGLIGNVKYDFTHLSNVDVLMYIAGHAHYDSETYYNNVLHLTTASDVNWTTINSKQRNIKEGTVDEQCFDCICINKRNKLVHAFRIGYGNDRHFHLAPNYLSVNKRKKLKTSMIKPVNWTIIDTDNVHLKKESKVNQFVEISNDGFVKGLKECSVVVVAKDRKGNKEFFNVIVKGK